MVEIEAVKKEGTAPETSKQADVSPEAAKSYIENDLKDILDKYDTLYTAQDDDEQPYKSKYEGRELLLDAAKRLQAFCDANSDQKDAENGPQERVAELTILLARNYFWCEETPTAEKKFMEGLQLYMRNSDRRARNLKMCQATLNDLGILWMTRNMPETAIWFLRRAQVLYETYCKHTEEAQRDKLIENNYSITTLHLATAYQTHGNGISSAMYCAETLARHLAFNKNDKATEFDRDFDRREWVRSCATLAEFFFTRCDFATGEYCITAADVLAQELADQPDIPRDWGELQTAIQKHYCNYFLNRLKKSHDFTSEREEFDAHLKWILEPKAAPKNLEKSLRSEKRLEFHDNLHEQIEWDEYHPLEVELEDESDGSEKLLSRVGATTIDVGNGITCDINIHFPQLHDRVVAKIQARNKNFFAAGEKAIGGGKFCMLATKFETARELFKSGNSLGQEVLKAFPLNGHVTDHLNCLFDVVQLWNALQSWETDQGRVKSMINKRIKMLEPLLDQLSEKHYASQWRAIARHVAEANQELWELMFPGGGKVDNLELAAKLNNYVARAIKYYDQYAATFFDPLSKKDNIPSEYEREYALCKLAVARVSTKLIGTPDVRIESHKRALKEYRWLEKYYKEHENLKEDETLQAEYSLTQDMLSLLPSQMDNIARGSQTII